MKQLIQCPSMTIYDLDDPQRTIKNYDDWGDYETIFLRIEKIFYPRINGIYLGEMYKKYIVGVINNNRINTLESFESLSELKHNWIPKCIEKSRISF